MSLALDGDRQRRAKFFWPSRVFVKQGLFDRRKLCLSQGVDVHVQIIFWRCKYSDSCVILKKHTTCILGVNETFAIDFLTNF